MPQTISDVLKLYRKYSLRIHAIFHLAIPLITPNNVQEFVAALDAEDSNILRRMIEATDPYYCAGSSHWPVGPTTPEIRDGIIALKQYFEMPFDIRVT